MHLLNEIDSWLGSRHTVARAGEVRAIEQEVILVGARAERRDGVVLSARWCRRRDPWGRLDEVEHAIPSRRNRSDVLGPEPRAESRIASLDARPCSFDHNGLSDSSQLQDYCSLERGPSTDSDIRFVITVKSLQLDVEGVVAWRQNRKPQLTFLVRGHRHLPANQCRRGEAGQGTAEDAALGIFDSTDQRSGEGLCVDYPGRGQPGRAEEQHSGNMQTEQRCHHGPSVFSCAQCGYRAGLPAASPSVTYAATSRICSGVNALRNGGMLLRPLVTVAIAASRSRTLSSGAPPVCPPLPSSP